MWGPLSRPSPNRVPRLAGTKAYPALAEKAAALCFSLVMNHPFADGNKRVGHAALEVFLVLNGHELRAKVAESEKLMLDLASGMVSREQLVAWVGQHTVKSPLE